MHGDDDDGAAADGHEGCVNANDNDDDDDDDDVVANANCVPAAAAVPRSGISSIVNETMRLLLLGLLSTL